MFYYFIFARGGARVLASSVYHFRFFFGLIYNIVSFVLISQLSNSESQRVQLKS